MTIIIVFLSHPRVQFIMSLSDDINMEFSYFRAKSFYKIPATPKNSVQADALKEKNQTFH